MNFTTAQFGVAMENLKKEVRRGIIDPHYGTLSEQGRLLLERIIKFTPAKTEDQQRHAIRNDLLNIFEIHREETIKAAALKYGRSSINGWVHDDRHNVHVLLQVAGLVTEEHQLKAIHRANYSARGRTKKLSKGFKYAISNTMFSAYLEYLYKSIGKAKAGWLPAAARLFAKNIPQFVLRHSPGQGTFTDGRQTPRPYIEVHNSTRWSVRKDEGQRIVDGAIASRIRDMQNYARKQMLLAAKRAGLNAKAA